MIIKRNSIELIRTLEQQSQETSKTKTYPLRKKSHYVIDIIISVVPSVFMVLFNKAHSQ